MALAKKTVLMVMVDALRHDYITVEDAPFLSRLAEQGASGSLQPSFGFEPDGAYFAGLDPEECDGGAQYWRRPGDRVFRLVWLFRLFDWVPSAWWRTHLRKGIRLVAQLMASDPMTRAMAPCNRIPLELLPQFSFPMVKHPCDPGFTPQPSIFDVIRDNGGSFYFHGHPAYKVKIDAVVDRYLAEEDGSNDLAFLFIGDLDGIGHRFGPDSPERRAMLARVDNGLRRIYEAAQARYETVDILVFGDHGMAQVDQLIDLRALLASAQLDRRTDAWFLDSTFARFWVQDKSRRQRLVDLLNQQPGGHVLSEAETETYRIRYPHNYFGDVIFVVDDHALIHPSFYSVDSRHPEGMHGYLPGCRDNESAFVMLSDRARGRGEQGRIDMRRVFPTLVQMLGLSDRCEIPHDLKDILS